MLKLIRLLMAYRAARSMSFQSREELEAYQSLRLAKFLDWVTQNSLYFATYRGFWRDSHNKLVDLGAQALETFPLMDKSVMMENFDDMNTAHLPLSAVMDLARGAEATRDFQGTLEGYTVGLSSGTSATRGAFIVSQEEQARWAGVILAKLLPDGIFAGERVALFLRADSGLYQTVKTPWLTFQFFDLVGEFDTQASKLEAYAPTILVAPAQVLRELALRVQAEHLDLIPKKVVSVAEVLEPQDREIIESVFGTVHQVYQATEGFLASTCEHGTLHLNEEYVHIEKEWLDKEKGRFVPIITDFTRTTQPIVRYRLNDVLVAKSEPCKCGRVTQAIDSIEGRCDDMLFLPREDGSSVPIFADALSRVIAQALPLRADYRLTQLDRFGLKLDVAVDAEELPRIRDAISRGLFTMGADVSRLHWTLSTEIPAFVPSVKRRRITNASKSQ
jgi:putative adenylate-forming enzyme